MPSPVPSLHPRTTAGPECGSELARRAPCGRVMACKEVTQPGCSGCLQGEEGNKTSVGNQQKLTAADPSLAQPQEKHSAAPCPPPGTRGECSGVQGPRQCLRHQPGEDFTKPSCSSPSLATFIAWELATACSRKGVKLMICQFGTPAQPCGGAACRCHTGSTARMRSAMRGAQHRREPRLPWVGFVPPAGQSPPCEVWHGCQALSPRNSASGSRKKQRGGGEADKNSEKC